MLKGEQDATSIILTFVTQSHFHHNRHLCDTVHAAGVNELARRENLTQSALKSVQLIKHGITGTLSKSRVNANAVRNRQRIDIEFAAPICELITTRKPDIIFLRRNIRCDYIRPNIYGFMTYFTFPEGVEHTGEVWKRKEGQVD